MNFGEVSEKEEQNDISWESLGFSKEFIAERERAALRCEELGIKKLFIDPPLNISKPISPYKPKKSFVDPYPHPENWGSE